MVKTSLNLINYFKFIKKTYRQTIVLTNVYRKSLKYLECMWLQLIKSHTHVEDLEICLVNLCVVNLAN